MFYFKKEENYFLRMLTGEVYYALYCNVSISIDPEPVAEALVAGDIPGSTWKPCMGPVGLTSD